MAYIEPNTEIRFLHDVPLDPDYENTLYFDNKEQQTNYFLNRTKHTFTNQSYQRKNRGWLRVGFLTDVYGGSVIRDLYNSTYMMFKNSNYENKWFYAFVDKVEYVNNNTVDVQYHIDVMQTWHFDYVLNQCLIEREHASVDIPGSNTLPEDLEHGEYFDDIPTYDYDGNPNNSGLFEFNPGICLVTSFDPATLYGITGDVESGRIIYGLELYGDLYSGCFYTIWPLSSSVISSINGLLDAINSNAKIDGVVALFMFPYDFKDSITGNARAAIKTLTFDKPTRIGAYTPRNKKLLTYPYSFLYISNNQGNAATYRYEFFTADRPVLRLWGNVSTDSGMVCWPYRYKGTTGWNTDEIISVTGFPMCSFAYDAYKAWVAQNVGTHIAKQIDVVTDLAKTLAAPSVSSIEGTLDKTAYTLGEKYNHQIMPPQIKGNTNLSMMYQAGLMTFAFFNKRIKEEYAYIIDKYFDMYGYASHRVGVPNRNVRRCYTYVKTIGCSIHGDLPSDDIISIQNLFNRGIRFWRSSAVFGNYDYSVNNNAV